MESELHIFPKKSIYFHISASNDPQWSHIKQQKTRELREVPYAFAAEIPTFVETFQDPLRSLVDFPLGGLYLYAS